MRKLNRIAVLVSCLVTAFSFSACQEDTYDIAYEYGKDKIVCAWWGNDARNMYTLEGIELFQKKNPNINVECKFGMWGGYGKRQNIYMYSHEQPDVMLINYDWIKKYSSDGNGFYNLYNRKEYIDLSNFSQEVLSYGEVDGKLNAVPVALNSHIFYYNKDLMNEYGIDMPKTWDDLFDYAKILKKDNKYMLCMNSKSLFFFLVSYFEQSTGRFTCNDDGEITLNKNDIKFMISSYKKFIDENVILPINSNTSKSFYTGLSVGMIRWASSADEFFRDIREDKGAEIVIGDFPRFEGVKRLGWYVKPSMLYAISAETTKPAESAKLLNFLINDPEMAKLQKTEKGVPISRSAASAINDEIGDSLEAAASSKIIEYSDELSVMPVDIEAENVYGNFKNESDKYLSGETTLDEAVDKIYDKICK